MLNQGINYSILIYFLKKKPSVFFKRYLKKWVDKMKHASYSPLRFFSYRGIISMKLDMRANLSALTPTRMKATKLEF